MLQALLNGKLSREQENMEDILTSNVFGLLKYVEHNLALFPFFRKAIDINNHHPLENLIGKNAKVNYEFWPSWGEEHCKKCEPDVVLTIDTEDTADPNYLIAIEAKLFSGKSSHATNDVGSEDKQPATDQLGKEWQNFDKMDKFERRNVIDKYLILKCHTIYVIKRDNLAG